MALRARPSTPPDGRGGPPRWPASSSAAAGVPSCDDAGLVATLRAQLGGHGVRADDLRCPSGLRGRGRRDRCGAPSPSAASRSTRSRRSSAVGRRAPSPTTCTPRRGPSAKDVARTRRWRRSSQQAGVPAGTASCAGDLPRAGRGDRGVHTVRPGGCRDLDASGPPRSTAARSTTPSSRRVLHDRRSADRWRPRRSAAGPRDASSRSTACGKVATDDSVEEQIKSQLGTDTSDCPTDLKGEPGQSIVCKATKGERGLRRQGHGHLRGRRHHQLHDRAGRCDPPRPPTAPRGHRRPRRPSPGRPSRRASSTQLAADGKQVDEVSCPDLPRDGRGVAAVHPQGRRRQPTA